jgi:hypothetical protein
MIKPCGLVCCVAYPYARSQSCAPSHPSLSSSLSAPCLVSLPASAAIAGTCISTSPAGTPRPAPNTSRIASSHFPRTNAQVHRIDVLRQGALLLPEEGPKVTPEQEQ